MLRILHAANSLPYYWPVDSSSSFQAGMVAQLTVQGNQVVATVSNGTAPLGLIDDQRTNVFTANVWDEMIIQDATGVPGPGGSTVTAIDIMVPLKNPNISTSSFVSIPAAVQLIPRNGIIIIPAGTPLNYDNGGVGSFNSVKTNVRYTYQIPNIIGDDTTAGSNRVTIWFSRVVFSTDQMEVAQSYPVNANLFVSEAGLLTTRQPSPSYPPVALVLGPPSPLNPTIEALWL